MPSRPVLLRSVAAAATLVVVVAVVALRAALQPPPHDDPPAPRPVATGPPRAVIAAASEGERFVPAPAGPLLTAANGRSIDLEGDTVAAFIDRLAPLARRGDAVAAYRVYQAEALCGRLSQASRWIRASAASESDDAHRHERAIAATVAACDGVTPAQMQERFGFLDQAVRAGDRDAMIDYRLEGPLGFAVEALDPDDLRLVEWKRDAHARLETLAARGDRDAWSLLATDDEFGIVADRDDAAALKYETAMVATSRQPDRDPLSLPFLAAIAQRLGTVDTGRAIDEGRALARRFPRTQP